MLAGVEAALADFSAIRAANDIRNSFTALATCFGRTKQLTSFQDELIEHGYCVLGCLIEWLAILSRFAFVRQISDFLNELVEFRLRLGGFRF